MTESNGLKTVWVNMNKIRIVANKEQWRRISQCNSKDELFWSGCMHHGREGEPLAEVEIYMTD